MWLVLGRNGFDFLWCRARRVVRNIRVKWYFEILFCHSREGGNPDKFDK